jgi:protein TonB
MRAPTSPRRTRPLSTAASVAAHALVLAAILATGRYATSIAPMRLPGTSAGTRFLPVYSLGGATGSLAESKPVPATHSVARSLPQPRPVPIPKPQPTSTATSPGTGSSGDAALGDGNINVALVRNHPTPSPDLSVLPHGTRGDIMLSIVIDATGRITDIKLDRGLNPAVDQTVIATVQQWNFAPATRNGQPIASEQELLFHYERG